MNVLVRSAKRAQAPQLAELLQDYLREFATFESVDQDESGQYVYPYLAHYWEDPNRYPFLFWLDERPVGFALLRHDMDPSTGRQVMDLAEFFVIPDVRRSGLGQAAAHRLWDLFPGPWTLRVLRSNKNAQPFWRKVISRYTGSRYHEQPPEGFAGGFYTFTFTSGSDLDLPDDISPDFID